MKISVLTAHHPFLAQTTDEVALRLAEEFNRAGHRAEVTSVPVVLDSLESLFDAVALPRMMRLDRPGGADVVIATRFPMGFVDHPNKVIWAYPLRHDIELLVPELSLGHWARGDVAKLDRFERAMWIGSTRSLTRNRYCSRELMRRLSVVADPVRTPLFSGPQDSDRKLPPTASREPGQFGVAVTGTQEHSRIDILLEAYAERADGAWPPLIVVGTAVNRHLQRLKRKVIERGLGSVVRFEVAEAPDHIRTRLESAAYYYEDRSSSFEAEHARLAIALGVPVFCHPDGGAVLDVIADSYLSQVVAPTSAALGDVMQKAPWTRSENETLARTNADASAGETWRDVARYVLHGTLRKTQATADLFSAPRSN